MTAKQEAKLNMQRATQKHCNDNAAIVATVPAFDLALKSLNAKIAAILATAQQEDLITKGITIDKAAARKILCQLATDTAAPIFAFASSNNNNQLMQEVNFTYSDLFKTKDDQLAPRCQNIVEAAKNNVAALAAYGITATSIDTLQTTINNYQSKVPDPRNAAALKTTVRINLKNLIAEADKVLKLQMDKTIASFKASNPDFVKTYKIDRIIIDPSQTTTTLKGVVKSSADNSAIAGATIKADGAVVTATTNEKGEYEIKPILQGKANLTASVTKFKETTISNVTIKKGQINKHDITLEPS